MGLLERDMEHVSRPSIRSILEVSMTSFSFSLRKQHTRPADSAVGQAVLGVDEKMAPERARRTQSAPTHRAHAALRSLGGHVVVSRGVGGRVFTVVVKMSKPGQRHRADPSRWTHCSDAQLISNSSEDTPNRIVGYEETMGSSC
ncbi:hypothetical protein F7725_026293 [Dissostichus mawsoni]|uniref:Uncharacterized protein n=1 Tax=Dissostichus mawsoni TaxID=36200 RepID=A0A7J5X847_DISMA|nr:hypothetical protein F7725_026293 [Dissostichus mawsoni]